MKDFIKYLVFLYPKTWCFLVFKVVFFFGVLRFPFGVFGPKLSGHTGKMCCNILREDDSEIISPLFKKKPIQLKDLFWWKKYVIYFFSCRDNEIFLSHLASYIKLGQSSGGSIFEKFPGGGFRLVQNKKKNFQYIPSLL